ncbi:MAG: gfo/Idh/MocA family oxidoreductase [Candidatus Electrothrix sp. AR1]|nr:gfo/Idh/MocA family oxidoreductase [Candidatus Electrothrix sp. AR1]
MINVAVVGCGYWGPNLIRNFIVNQEINLLWVCDLDTQRLGAVASNYPTVKKTTRLSDILNDPNVEGVALATPVSTHYTLAEQCLKSGKHVLMEKPFVSTSDQAKRLLALAKKQQLQILCDHTFCYTGAVKK